MRSHYCGHLTVKQCDSQVSLCGWVAKTRDHGGVIFIDLRDISGRAQIVCNPEDHEVFSLAEKVRNKYCLRVVGQYATDLKVAKMLIWPAALWRLSVQNLKF